MASRQAHNLEIPGSSPGPARVCLKKNMYRVYILHSQKIDRFYIGHTADMNDRLQRHNNGEVFSTKAHRPWELVYSEEFETRREAMMRERELKSWKKTARLQKLMVRMAG